MTDEYLKAIGRVTLNLQDMEQMCKSHYRTITGCSYYESGMESTISITQYLDRLKKLSKHLFPNNEELRKELRNVINKARVVNKKRNDIIHSFWGKNKDNPEKPWTKVTIGRYSLYSENYEKDSQPEIKEFTYQEINDIAEEINTVIYQWWELMNKILEYTMKEMENNQNV